MKKNALVVLNYNVSPEEHLVNGSLGIVEDIVLGKDGGEPHITVRFLYTGQTVAIHRMGFTLDQQVIYGNGAGGSAAVDIVGFHQFPLQLAWSLTVHKSQVGGQPPRPPPPRVIMTPTSAVLSVMRRSLITSSMRTDFPVLRLHSQHRG